jgi:PPOX class probable F420-dependent enzyme
MSMSDAVRRFLREPRFAVLATINPDGTPQQTVVWFEPRDDVVMLNTRAGTRKHRNLQRDQRASLCVEDGYTFVTLTGSVSFVEEHETSQRDIHALADRYDPDAEPGRWSYFPSQRRVTLIFRPDKIVTHGIG